MVIALLVVASSAMAVGKITVDPNTPGARAVAQAPDVDARLDQKVTCDARRQTVSSILADLAEQTGVALYTGYNNLDWQVRDRRMNLFSPGVSLKSLMDSISHVMKFKWSRKEADGKWTYRLYMDRKTLLGIDRQRLLDEERLSQLEDKQRERVVRDLTKAAAMSEEELASLRVTDPMLYVEAKHGWPALVPDLLTRVPAAKAAWTSGDALAFNGADLPSESQKALVKALGLMGGFMTKVYGPKNAPPKGAFDDLSKVTVSINASRKLGSSPGCIWIGDFDLDGPGLAIRTSFVDPDSPAAQELGRAYARILDGEHVDGQKLQELVLALEGQKTSFGEPITEHPDDPALAVKVKLKPMGNSFADLLRAVSKASGYAVVSDSFAIYNRGFEPVNADVVLKDALDKLSIQYRYNWDRQGSVLEFRDREWFRKRGYQVPESWLEPWRKSLKRTGTLTLDQLAQMSLLDDNQVGENLFCDDVLNVPWLVEAFTTGGDILRGYARLSDDQRTAMFSETGLSLTAISPSQWDRVSRMLRSKPQLDLTADDNIVLTGRQTKVDKPLQYTFTAASADGQSTKWDVTIPMYSTNRAIWMQPWVGEEKRALELLNESRRDDSIDSDQWFKLAMLLYDSKHYREALETLRRVSAPSEKDPLTRFDALIWTGQILDLLGRRDEAIAAYKEAMKIDIGDKTRRFDQYDIAVDREYVEERLKTPFECK